MAENELAKFIETARQNGVSDDQTKDTLSQHGWQIDDINRALSQTQNNSNVPVPPPVPHFGMWIAFLYIILFISLYVSATAFGGILHRIVDDKIPDALSKNIYSSTSSWETSLMQSYLACLIVGFPIFASLFIFLKSQTHKNPQMKGLRSRKLLVYATLIGTFLIIIANVIGTVYGFLGGTLTSRSLAHLGVTLFVAGSIFFYFILDVWGDRKQV